MLIKSYENGDVFADWCIWLFVYYTHTELYDFMEPQYGFPKYGIGSHGCTFIFHHYVVLTIHFLS